MAAHRYETTSRSPGTTLATLFGVALATFALVIDAPWYVQVIFVATGGGLLAYWLADVESGSEMDAGAFSYWVRRERTTFRLSRIERLVVREWSDSVDVDIVTAIGSQRIPSNCYPSAKAIAGWFENAGIPVEKR